MCRDKKGGGNGVARKLGENGVYGRDAVVGANDKADLGSRLWIESKGSMNSLLKISEKWRERQLTVLGNVRFDEC